MCVRQAVRARRWVSVGGSQRGAPCVQRVAAEVVHRGRAPDARPAWHAGGRQRNERCEGRVGTWWFAGQGLGGR